MFLLLLLFCCVLFSNWLTALFMGILRVPWLYLFIIYILPRTVVNKTTTTATNRKKYRKCANFYGPAALSRACEYLFIYESSSMIPRLCVCVSVCVFVGVWAFWCGFLKIRISKCLRPAKWFGFHCRRFIALLLLFLFLPRVSLAFSIQYLFWLFQL